MAHVLWHVHTCIQLYTVFNTISPIHNYKLYLNTVYNYFITIYIQMLPMLLYPKLVKKYIFFMSTVWGLLPYKIT